MSSEISVVLQKDLYSQILDIFEQNHVRNYCIEKQTVSVSLLEKITTVLSDFKLNNDIDASEIINNKRSIKNIFEIEKIKKSQEITDKAFNYILGKIKEGKTEKELALELEFFIRSNGAENVSFDIIFIAGKNTSLPHGVPSDYKLQKGDLITMDFGSDFDGYKSDMTKTVALGKISEEQKIVYNTVLDAQNAAFELIREGIECSKVDKAARDVISNAGYG